MCQSLLSCPGIPENTCKQVLYTAWCCSDSALKAMSVSRLPFSAILSAQDIKPLADKSASHGDQARLQDLALASRDGREFS